MSQESCGQAEPAGLRACRDAGLRIALVASGNAALRRRSWRDGTWVDDGPQGEPAALLLSSAPHLCTFGFLASAWRHGARQVVYPWLGSWRRTALLRVMLDHAVNGVVRRLQIWLSGRRLRMRHWRRDPISRIVIGLVGLAGTPLARRRIARIAAPAQAAIEDRILLASTSLGAGGGERRAVVLATALRRQGAGEIALLVENTSGPDSFFLDTLRHQGITVITLPDPGAPAGMSWIADAERRLSPILPLIPADLHESLVRHTAYLLQHPPRVLHAFQDTTCLIAGVAAVAAGVPRVVLNAVSVSTPHFPFYRLCMGPLLRSLAAQPSVRLANNSHAGAGDYAGWLGLPRDRIAVIAAADTAVFGHPPAAQDIAMTRARLGLPESASVVGTVMRFDDNKDPTLWLQTAAILARRHPGLHFIMIGDGPLWPDSRKLAEALGLQDRCALPGLDADTRLCLSVCDVVLMTSHVEGAPMVAVEAQLLGIPVVGTMAGAIAETFIDGETGTVIHRRDPQLLADAVDRWLLAHRDDGTLPHRCRSHARENFSSDRAADRLMALYS